MNATIEDVLTRFCAAGYKVEKVPGMAEWRTRCPRKHCQQDGALRIYATPGEGELQPFAMWCKHCKRLDMADVDRLPVKPARITASAFDSLPALDDAALYGPIGHYVRALAPHTEASPAGILAATLTTVGAMLGRGPHCLIEGAPHHARFMTLLVGSSSTARKGTAMHHGCGRVIHAVDADFFTRTVSGLSSAEGLIQWVRDPIPEGEGPNGKGDPGITDKRLLVRQGEAAGLFRVLEREGNTLSARLREAWDGDSLQVMTRAAPLVATDPHVCIVASITPSELARSLKAVEVQNGLANRFMPFWCERECYHPHGGNDDQPEVLDALQALRRSVADSGTIGRVTWTPEGHNWWSDHYADLTTPAAGGALGTLMARGAPIVQRLALLFAVLDGKRERNTAHCEAALAVWRYVEGTWRALYATADVLSDRAQRLLAALNDAGPDGLPRSACRRGLGSGNIAAEDVGAALSELREAGLARPHRRATDGRTAERWVSMRNLMQDGRNGQEATESTHGDHKDHPASAPHDFGAPLELIASDGPPPDDDALDFAA